MKRILLGLAASLGILVLLEVVAMLPGSFGTAEEAAGGSHLWLAARAAGTMFIAALTGAYVARVGFIGPAVILTIGIWLYLVYAVNSIAAVAGRSDLVAVALENGLSLLFGIVGAVLGALLGRWFSKRDGSNVTTAA